MGKINNYLATERQTSANSIVIFACAGKDGFFEALQLDAAIDRHELYIDSRPHLFTLARLQDQFPKYAVVVANTNSARIFVFGLSSTLATEEVQGIKTKSTSAGGWSQARYQRHVENYHLHHAKEVIGVLERVVRDEHIAHVIFAGEEVVIPILREQLPPALETKVVEIMRMDTSAQEHQVLQATLEAMQRYDAQTDAERVQAVIGDYLAGGLATAGAEQVLAALSIGQVDEVLLSASTEQIKPVELGQQNDTRLAQNPPSQQAHGRSAQAQLADEIIRRAKQTAANVRFIEDAGLLASVGGVAASLRYQL